MDSAEPFLGTARTALSPTSRAPCPGLRASRISGEPWVSVRLAPSLLRSWGWIGGVSRAAQDGRRPETRCGDQSLSTLIFSRSVTISPVPKTYRSTRVDSSSSLHWVWGRCNTASSFWWCSHACQQRQQGHPGKPGSREPICDHAGWYSWLAGRSLMHSWVRMALSWAGRVRPGLEDGHFSVLVRHRDMPVASHQVKVGEVGGHGQRCQNVPAPRKSEDFSLSPGSADSDRRKTSPSHLSSPPAQNGRTREMWTAPSHHWRSSIRPSAAPIPFNGMVAFGVIL